MQFEYRSKRFDIEGVSGDDHIYKRIARSRTFYEIDLLEHIRRLKSFILSKKKRNVVLDIGANVGNHAIFLSAFVADHLIAIEPNPEVLGVLRRNLSRNADNYTVFECAVGENKCKGDIFLPGAMNRNVGGAQVVSNEDAGDIDISTLDAVISEWETGQEGTFDIVLMKIDVEGMEPAVLKGAEKTLRKYKPHVFVEAATKRELREIADCLRPLGYRKLPGRWASTPVYHFAYRPGLLLWAVSARARSVKRRQRKRNRRIQQRSAQDA